MFDRHLVLKHRSTVLPWLTSGKCFRTSSTRKNVDDFLSLSSHGIFQRKLKPLNRDWKNVELWIVSRVWLYRRIVANWKSEQGSAAFPKGIPRRKASESVASPQQKWDFKGWLADGHISSRPHRRHLIGRPWLSARGGDVQRLFSPPL